MQGATETEQLVGAARSNNESLIESLLDSKSAITRAAIINSTRDPVGNTLLHLAAANGAYEVLDLLLDQEGVEIEPVNRLQRNTPLHSAVEFAVGDEIAGKQVVELLIEAGASALPRNAAGKRPIDLATGADSIAQVLRGAQYALEMEREAASGGPTGGDGPADEDDQDDGPSDSDEEPEEPTGAAAVSEEPPVPRAAPPVPAAAPSAPPAAPPSKPN